MGYDLESWDVTHSRSHIPVISSSLRCRHNQLRCLPSCAGLALEVLDVRDNPGEGSVDFDSVTSKLRQSHCTVYAGSPTGPTDSPQLQREQTETSVKEGSAGVKEGHGGISDVGQLPNRQSSAAPAPTQAGGQPPLR